jgi:hypothetical protein
MDMCTSIKYSWNKGKNEVQITITSLQTSHKPFTHTLKIHYRFHQLWILRKECQAACANICVKLSFFVIYYVYFLNWYGLYSFRRKKILRVVVSQNRVCESNNLLQADGSFALSRPWVQTGDKKEFICFIIHCSQ